MKGTKRNGANPLATTSPIKSTQGMRLIDATIASGGSIAWLFALIIVCARWRLAQYRPHPSHSYNLGRCSPSGYTVLVCLRHGCILSKLKVF